MPSGCISQHCKGERTGGGQRGRVEGGVGASYLKLWDPMPPGGALSPPAAPTALARLPAYMPHLRNTVNLSISLVVHMFTMLRHSYSLHD